LSQRTLNLGILAHVDAGKTTLTERLRHAAGVIDEIGSVDAGTTQTDSLALERLRGITGGEGVAETSFGGYQPVIGPPPARPRTTANPLNRDEYMQLAGRPAHRANSLGGLLGL
jgi:ribosomal protection tetracycline resistance protein